MEKEDLVYAVLDEEAKQNALKTPETKEKRKRGRPRKEQAQKAVEEALRRVSNEDMLRDAESKNNSPENAENSADHEKSAE